MKDADYSWVFTLPLDVIWKRRMGERYCTWPRLVALTFIMYFAMMMMTFFFISSPTSLSPKTPKFIGGMAALIGFYGLPLSVWIFGAKNMAEITQRKKAGVQVHSYYMGTPRFLPDKEIVHRLVIPAGSILAGVVFFPLLAPIGAYIALMGLCQFLMYSGIRTQSQTRKLDEEDRRMTREWKMAEKAGGRDRPESVVQITEARHPHAAAEEAAFYDRWKNVLQRQPPPGRN